MRIEQHWKSTLETRGMQKRLDSHQAGRQAGSQVTTSTIRLAGLGSVGLASYASYGVLTGWLAALQCVM